MKRKLKWIGGFLVVLLIGFGTALFLLPRDRITVDTHKRIQIGMTVEEVESILGKPDCVFEEGSRGIAKVPGLIRMHQGDLFWPVNIWEGRHGILDVCFDDGGKVRGKEFWSGRFGEPTLLDRLRDWLGW